MLSEATSGLNVAAGLTRSWTVMYGAPPVVRFTTAFVDCLMRGRKRPNASGVWSGLPGLFVARVQMHDRRSGFGRADRRLGDLFGRHRQVGRHRRGVDRAGHRAGNDDLVARRHRALLDQPWFSARCPCRRAACRPPAPSGADRARPDVRRSLPPGRRLRRSASISSITGPLQSARHCVEANLPDRSSGSARRSRGLRRAH